jgi:penicillin-insensitive murein endopeptidase
MRKRTAFAVALLTLATWAGVASPAVQRHLGRARASSRGSLPLFASVGRLNAGTHMRLGRSIGSPTDGHLIGGAHLDAAAYLRIVPTYAQGDVRWALEPLVSMLGRAARVVRHQYADAVMSVGHLSRPGGGELDRHASHESGRDADLGFYIRSYDGRPLYSDHFVPFRGDASAPSWPGAFFDDARNWALIAVLVTDPGARLTHIFVAAPLRARLLAYAERTGAPMHVRIRAAELMAQPRGALPHDDHFHVRIGCPAGMTGCIELPTPPRLARFPRAPMPRNASKPAHNGRGALGAPSTLRPRDAAHVPATPSPSPAAPNESESPSSPDDDPTEPRDEGAPAAILSSPMDDVDGPLAAPARGPRKALP